MFVNFFFPTVHAYEGFLCGSDGKEYAWNAGDPGSGRSSGEENGNPLQYSCLENSMDRGAWWVQSIRVGHHLVANIFIHTYTLTYIHGLPTDYSY